MTALTSTANCEIVIKENPLYDEDIINQIVDIHMETFSGFFLTFLGKGFLKQLYKGFSSHEQSGLLVAEQSGSVVGILAYSEDLSAFYRYLIKKSLLPFAWYSLRATIRKPSAMMRLVRAFLKPGESKREESYIELSSIGVLPQIKGYHIGSRLIDELKRKYDSSRFSYIKLETDAEGNDGVNAFYLKNGFSIDHEYTTPAGRKMYEYRWSK
jgi:ribosomal protein S18 acetylase RimI-like enzyme